MKLALGNCVAFIIAALILMTVDGAVFGYNPSAARLSIVDWNNYNYHEPNGPGTYAFGYDIEDPATNNVQFRNEERHPNGTVTGSYGYVEPDGNVRIVHYIADEKGYRATEENSLKLSMLRPLSPFASPELAAALQSQGNYRVQEIHDQRTRPFDKFYNHNNNFNNGNRENWYYQHNLINGLPVRNDLYQRDRFGYDPNNRENYVRFPEGTDGYEVREEPRRYYFQY